mmetsp:Transcript_45372/g.73613  ORF Transcript_45372/g.73613 Transcript_45372/m.73613 type:complete len:201 (-) Transcript_45372:898-1500(-)
MRCDICSTHLCRHSKSFALSYNARSCCSKQSRYCHCRHGKATQVHSTRSLPGSVSGPLQESLGILGCTGLDFLLEQDPRKRTPVHRKRSQRASACELILEDIQGTALRRTCGVRGIGLIGHTSLFDEDVADELQAWRQRRDEPSKESRGGLTAELLPGAETSMLANAGDLRVVDSVVDIAVGRSDHIAALEVAGGREQPP